MSELLLEILCEEIPARMQARAEAALGDALASKLNDAGLRFDASGTYSGPRRLSVWVEGLPATSQDKIEEKKGPKLGAPDGAIQGFLRGAGLSDVSEATLVEDPKKGAFYVARKTIKGQPTADIIAGIIPDILAKFSWPKSMKTGHRTERWVRPINGILCVLNGAVVPFSWGGIEASNTTQGHRFFGRGPYTITGIADYKTQLEGEGHVRLTRAERIALIQRDAEAVCTDAGLNLLPDPKLVEELAGLTEWPVVLLGTMETRFLELPDEVIQLSMRTHQKYMAVRDASNTKLAPHFVVVANIPARDGGEKIKAGNARVLSARLSDGKFFWDQDIATGLDGMAGKLSTITFKQELGSMADKVARVSALADGLAAYITVDKTDVATATRLMKNDLVSQMVYEFPELQGIMGGYYAKAGGQNAAIAAAISEHYSPQGPSDSVPTQPVSVICALADKFDSLVGFWAIDQKPTGSKDPFALRRAALGIVRILLENEIRLPLRVVIADALRIHALEGTAPDCAEDLLRFFSDRLAGHLKSEGVGHDRIAAVFALGHDDLTDITRRAKALDGFLKTEDGANLLAGYKRASNILGQAGSHTDATEVQEILLKSDVERALYAELGAVETDVGNALQQEDYAAAMQAISSLRVNIDGFFDGVMVNDEDPTIRANRYAILQQFIRLMSQIAEFALIQD